MTNDELGRLEESLKDSAEHAFSISAADLDAVLAIIASARSERWIAVEERLPETDVTVVAYQVRPDLSEPDDDELVLAFHERSTSEWVRDHDLETIRVSHWRPLPEPPKCVPSPP